jgi:hypothetical protein
MPLGDGGREEEAREDARCVRAESRPVQTRVQIGSRRRLGVHDAGDENSIERLHVHRTLSLASVVVFGLAALAFMPGCGPAKAGDACTKGSGACVDGKNMLSCQGDKFVQVSCSGAKGCAVAGEKVTCDFSANKAGDVCSTEDEGGAMCGADQKSVITCTKGKFAISACGGPEGCKEKDGKSTCDNSIAKVGDACDGGNACAPDGKNLLECKDGKFAQKMECKGPKGCDAKGEKINCDAEEAAPAAPADSAAAAPADSAAPAAAPAD